MSRWHVVVVVPARDEEQSIKSCVSSIHRAALLVRPWATVDIVVVADSCTDETADVVRRRWPTRCCVLELDAGCVGAARRAGVAAGLSRSTASRDRVWIANTDADTTVPVTWLVSQLRLARRGVAAVAGVVRLDDRVGSALRHAFAMSYPISADGSHAHVHGANLGVRADVYLGAGGWSAQLCSSEDHDLWGRLVGDNRVVATDAVWVITSPRSIGRAPNGFAANIAAHIAALTA
ncbi:MAG TPA: glycosyltransferase [Ilumatobacteraceae bacterium]